MNNDGSNVDDDYDDHQNLPTCDRPRRGRGGAHSRGCTRPRRQVLEAAEAKKVLRESGHVPEAIHFFDSEYAFKIDYYIL